MSRRFTTTLAALTAATAMGLSSGAVLAQSAPEGPVEIFVGASPGGGYDRMARSIESIIVEKSLLDVPLNITYHPGGGGAVAWATVNRSPGDMTKLSIFSPDIVTNEALGATDEGFADFTMLSTLVFEDGCFAVNPAGSIKTADDKVAALKTDASAVRFGFAVAAGNQWHVAMAKLTDGLGADITKVRATVFDSAGKAVAVPGTVIQRNCGSGLGAIVSAAHAIAAGEAETLIAGGVESMSRAPFVVAKAERAFDRQLTWYDSAVGARFPNPRIEQEYGNLSNVGTADNLAQDHALDRAACDAFALRSQERYSAAAARGGFDGEVVPVVVPGGRKSARVTVAADECPRPGTTMAALEALRPICLGGVTTAGNAPGLSDGAAVLTTGTRAAGERAGVAPMARVIASAVAGVPPRTMGHGPVPASLKALDRAGLTLADMDVIEINEAFAAQVLACLRGMGLAFDDPRVNPNGGAIAIGHPLGASGPRIALAAARELRRRGGRYALVSMCIGVGQGIAVILENPDA